MAWLFCNQLILAMHYCSLTYMHSFHFLPRDETAHLDCRSLKKTMYDNRKNRYNMNMCGNHCRRACKKVYRDYTHLPPAGAIASAQLASCHRAADVYGGKVQRGHLYKVRCKHIYNLQHMTNICLM